MPRGCRLESILLPSVCTANLDDAEASQGQRGHRESGRCRLQTIKQSVGRVFRHRKMRGASRRRKHYHSGRSGFQTSEQNLLEGAPGRNIPHKRDAGNRDIRAGHRRAVFGPFRWCAISGAVRQGTVCGTSSIIRTCCMAFSHSDFETPGQASVARE